MDSRELGVRARSALAGTRFAALEWVVETGSTNADLLVEAAAGAPEGRVRATEHQNAGRGRRDRSWDDEPGAALMVSVLLRPRLPPAQLARLTMAWGLAALDGCREVAGVELALKWPNDVVNPAAKTTPGCPIYGMPILDVGNAANVIFLKRSMRPGFAGIENELLYDPKTTLLFGDAKASLTKVVSALKAF